MSEVREAAETLLSERPHLAADLREVLAVDEARETWTFDDVPVDSGTFGELVSRGVVAKEGGEYRVADPGAVRAALDGPEGRDGDAAGGGTGGAVALPSGSLRAILPAVTREGVAALGGGLLVVLAFRLLSAPAVFRGGDVVLLSNDPYFYAYWLRRMAGDSAGPLSVPEGIRAGEPLMVATLSAAADLLGGDPAAVESVLAWYPVVAGLVTAALVYLLACRLTGDRRVALAAVLLLAVTPVHAFRTAVGFGDHHAFDYVWVGLAAYALVVLAEREAGPAADTDGASGDGTGGTPVAGVLRSRWPWVLVVGLAVAAGTLAWTAGPLLLVPVGLAVALRALADVGAGRSPLPAGVPVVLGVAVGAGLAGAVHAGLGWQPGYVVVASGLLAVGAAAVVAVGEVAHRAGLSARALAGGEALALGASLAGGMVLFPSFGARFRAEVAQLILKENVAGIAEARSLFAEGLGGFFGPVFFFGFGLFVALPYVAWAVWTGLRDDRPAWLVPGAYAWTFLVFGLLQVRFAGQLSLFAALFAGLGFVHLAGVVELGPRPAVLSGGDDSDGRRLLDSNGSDDRGTPVLSVPDARTLGLVLALFLLVGGLGTMLTPLRVNLVTIGGEKYQAAQAMDKYAAEHGLEYPENYVLSLWDRNRMYNYFVNGESESYGYARVNYNNFLRSTDGEKWYRKLGDRGGFVVVENIAALSNYSDNTLYGQLQRFNGSGLEHYRMVALSEDGNHKAYAVLPGATITGRTAPNETIHIRHRVPGINGPIIYEQHTTAADNGWYSITTPYPAIYSLENDSFRVTERDVAAGEFVRESPIKQGTYFPMDAGKGSVIFDTVGRHHGRVRSASWRNGIKNRALTFSGDGYATVPSSDQMGIERGFNVSLWFKTNNSTSYRSKVRFPRLISNSPLDRADGFQLLLSRGRIMAILGNGKTSTQLVGPTVDDGKWHRVSLTWNGQKAVLTIDGRVVDHGHYEHGISVSRPVTIGATATRKAKFIGKIDEVRIFTNRTNESGDR